MKKYQLLPALFITILLFACQQKKNNAADPYQPKEYVELKHPEWTKNATIYEVNLRQFTNEGTFKAFESHLPRLKEMGIDIIWLMHIHPETPAYRIMERSLGRSYAKAGK